MAKTTAPKRQVAYSFTGDSPMSREVLGGKGLSLAEMANLGVPVPPGFTVTTSVARAYIQNRTTPKRLAWQRQWGLTAIEKELGNRFGDPRNPLLLSVRSGAAISMPGMMDTILNLGLTPEVVEGFAALFGRRFAFDCYRRFLAMFGEVVLGASRHSFEAILDRVKRDRRIQHDNQLDEGSLELMTNLFRNQIERETGTPMVDDPALQLEMAMEAVLKSWDTPRAREYRRVNRIPDNLGTAINVQAMVFGNRDDASATGVVFSRDCATGARGIWGEFLINAQGEDVVAGIRKPLNLAEHMPSWNRTLFDELCGYVDMLERKHRQVVELEWTAQSGQLFILQSRKGKLTPAASVTVACHFHWDGWYTKAEALAAVTPAELKAVSRPVFKLEALDVASKTRLLACGLPASPGAAVGKVVFTSEAAVEAAKRGESVVLVRPDTSPDDLHGMLAAVAFVTQTGGFTSHAAVVARSLGKPCVVGYGRVDGTEDEDQNTLNVSEGDIISVDGETGMIIFGAVETTEVVNKKEVNLFLKWDREAKGGSFPKPRLDFAMFDQSAPISRLIGDFYLTDAMWLAAAGSKLESEAVKLRVRVHTEVAERLAMYLAVAVGGEIRYANGYTRVKRSPEIAALVTDFDIQLGGSNRNEAQRQSIAKLKTLDGTAHLRFAELVARAFSLQPPAVGAVLADWWPEKSVGGWRWGKIAEALAGFLSGKLPHSLFADHSFDLQHNNGCVFGKNRMIDVGVDPNRFGIKRALDAKKDARSVAQLFAVLNEVRDRNATSHYWPAGTVMFSGEVLELFRKGERTNLWQANVIKPRGT